MSCLNLKFPPAKTAWKIFATKIRRKLHVFHRPKKNSDSVHVPSSSRVRGGVRRPVFKRKRQRRSPVFIDELFRRPIQDGTVLEHGRCADPAKCGTSRSIKVVEWPIDVGVAETTRTSAEAGEGGESTTAAAGDDMWESVALASPLMRRIDERAEEFITKFRADMVHQEMVAGDL